jgi:hypothetical protein
VGAVLPTDYKDFISAYGLGYVDAFLWIHHPHAANRYLSLQQQAKEELAHPRRLREEGSRDVRFPLFPEPGGMLPWAHTVDAAVYFWVTGPADPDD